VWTTISALPYRVKGNDQLALDCLDLEMTLSSLWTRSSFLCFCFCLSLSDFLFFFRLWDWGRMRDISSIQTFVYYWVVETLRLPYSSVSQCLMKSSHHPYHLLQQLWFPFGSSLLFSQVPKSESWEKSVEAKDWVLRSHNIFPPCYFLYFLLSLFCCGCDCVFPRFFLE